MRLANAIGILRENHSHWERRAPLTPFHVKKLTSQGIQVLVQPSNVRIFTDAQYTSAGATVTEHLESANILFGIKQVPPQFLLPNRTYLFFSHTIKGQRENMPLLSSVLEKRVTLIDYECITQEGKRSIAFGTNAGRAGMLAGFRGLGERLLHMGYSTPFLNIGSAYMYSGLNEAKRAVDKAGERIAKQGIPLDLVPMTFVFTGNGKVSQGAQEIFKGMPHVMIHPSELPNVPREAHVLYGTVVNEQFLVRNKSFPDRFFEKKEYYAHPEQYEGIFHNAIAPYTSMLVNGMYWDARFPRLLTKKQMEELYLSDKRKLLGIADISCDIKGSIECTGYSTEIEKPFALYDMKEKKMRDSLKGDGIMMMTVDILPSEFAEESSEQFGNSLVAYAEILAQDSTLEALPESLKRACIASNGKLTPSFQYLAHRVTKNANLSLQPTQGTGKAISAYLQFVGHLFDTGFINEAFNAIEKLQGHFELVDCFVRPNFTSIEKRVSVSKAVVHVFMESHEHFAALKQNLKDLATSLPEAHIEITELEANTSTNASQAVQHMRSPSTVQHRVLCLGAGLVAAPLVEYLSRASNQEILVVSSIANEANDLKKRIQRDNIHPIHLDVLRDSKQIQQYIQTSSCVISLLPAPMHTAIAEYCIQARTPLVTASYVSPEMRSLDQRAKDANIPILCELGLDPGMDHLSAMKIIDEVKRHDGKILSFSSVCGGLPAPEAADNPIGYKFSWSPRGVLTAALNPAQYRKDNRIIQVKGKELMQNSERVHFLPAFALEQIPNRNSLIYGDIYGISDAHTIFRGTLRYAGCCTILSQLRELGLFHKERPQAHTWPEFMKKLLQDPTAREALRSDGMAFLQWLGVFHDPIPINNKLSTFDVFCALLQKKLSYAKGERDMAIMHHEFQIAYGDGKQEKRTSTFIGYGSEDGNTIMSQTVGITAAIGVQLILQDAVQNCGVLTPTTRDIYTPALEMLQEEGIAFREKVF